MPINWQAYLKQPGDTLTGQEINDLLDLVAQFIGTAGVSGPGLADADVPAGAGIPNTLMATERSYFQLQVEPSYDSVSASAQDNRFPPTSLPIHVRSQMESFDHQISGLVPTTLMLGRNGVVFVAAVLAQSDVVTRVALATPEPFEAGDVLTVVTGETLVALGQSLPVERASRLLRLDLNFRALG